MSRADQLRALDHFRRRLPHMSQTALSAVLFEARDGTIPTTHATRHAIHEAQESVLLRETPYGTVGQSLRLKSLTPGEHVDLVIANLPSMLHVAFSDCAPFRTFVQTRHDLYPSSDQEPWHLLVYGDEYNPGLELTSRHARKQWMVYCTFLEFGSVAIERAACWFNLAAALTSTVAKIDSGFSQLAGRLIRHLFCAPELDPTLGGVYLHFGGTSVTIHYTFGGFVMDGLAHKMLWGTKGDNATRLCTKCIGLYAKRSDDVADGYDGLVCSTYDIDTLTPCRDEHIRGSVRRVATFARTCRNNADFELRKQAIGFNHLPEGILNMPDLEMLIRPVTHALTEPDHTLYIHGVVQTVIYLYFNAFYVSGVTDIFAQLRSFLGQWHWPHEMHKSRSALLEIFDPLRVSRWREAKHLKCQAMEVKALLPVLGYWAAKFGGREERCALETRAFLRMLDMVEAISMRKSNRCTKATARERVKQFLDACVACGWEGSMHPKFHWLVHLCSELVVGALQCEDKHRVPKRYARETLNLTSFDRSVLANVVGAHFQQLSDAESLNFSCGLIRPTRATTKLLRFLKLELEEPGLQIRDCDVKQANFGRLATRGTVARGDIVLLDGRNSQSGVCAAEVWVICSVWDVPMALVSAWRHKIDMSAANGSAKWKPEAVPELHELEHILCPLVYRMYTEGVVTLVPAEYRRLLL